MTTDALDIARALVLGADLWLGALLLRIVWLRRRIPPQYQGKAVSNLTVLSLLGFLMLNVSRQVENMGDPLSWTLPFSAVCVTLGIIGVLRRVKVGVEHHGRTFRLEERRTEPRGKSSREG